MLSRTGGEHMVVRAERLRDNEAVILKYLPREQVTPRRRARLQAEADTLLALDRPDLFVTCLGLIELRTGIALEYQDANLNPISDGSFTAELMDAVAHGLTQAVLELHRTGFVHQRIDPSHVLTDGAGGVWLTGLAEATRLTQQQAAEGHQASASLAYRAPEQTGRTGGFIDLRTDLYGLGATLYHLLTGHAPFEADSTLALTHRIIAVEAPSATERNATAAPHLAAIASKLLAKAPEDRYQGARGVLFDLEQTQDLQPTELGSGDVPLQFTMSRKLYGRETTLTKLNDAYARVAAGATELTLISGAAGIGKSALVAELRNPIAVAGGRFVEGKFEQLRRAKPYSALRVAVAELIRQFAAESDAHLKSLRQELFAALGDGAGALAEVAPEIELLLGEVPELIELPPVEARNRLHLGFQQLFAVLTSPSRPVVLFLDDLQWADVGSMALVRRLLDSEEVTHLYVIGAFRDAEVDAEHPVRLALSNSPGASLTEVSIGPLDREAIGSLIADSLRCPREAALELADLVLEKADGNPFFTGQLLESLVDNGVVDFDDRLGYWSWDHDRVHSADVADNVVDLVRKRLDLLPGELRHTLRCAAIIGNEFDVELLGTIDTETPGGPGEMGGRLQSAVREGMLVALGGSDGHTFKFVHDRVQQAAYADDDEATAELNLRIGRILYQRLARGNADDLLLFRVVDHLNAGSTRIQEWAERDLLIDLNLRAGRRSNQAGAFDSAATYLERGIELAGGSEFGGDNGRLWSLHEQAQGAAYHSGNLAEVLRLGEIMLANAPDDLVKVDVLLIHIQAYFADGHLVEGVALSRQAFKLLGLKFPKRITQAHIITSFVALKARIRGRRPASFVDLPEATDPRDLKTMELLSIASVPVYSVEPNLLPLLVFRMVDISISKGNSEHSPDAYASLGVILCGVIGDLDLGYEFGKLAMDVLHRLDARDHLARTVHWVNAFTRCWRLPVRETLAPLLEGYRAGVETGDFQSAGYCLFTHDFHAFSHGANLSQCADDMRATSAMLRQLGQEKTRLLSELNRQVALNFIEPVSKPHLIQGRAFDDEKALQTYVTEEDGAGAFTIHVNRLILACFYFEVEAAWEAARAGRELLDHVVGSLDFSFFFFFEALAGLQRLDQVDATERRRTLKLVRANLRKLRKWAKSAPDNYLHRTLLIEAELSRVGSRELVSYDDAILAASRSGYLHEAALGNELAARQALATGREALARNYLLEAHFGYVKWGAAAKAATLAQDYRDILPNIETPTEAAASGGATVGALMSLDTLSVVESARALSSELMLDKLLARLLEITQQAAGAQRTALLLTPPDGGELTVEGIAEGESVSIASGVSPDWLALSVVNYVARTQDPSVIADIHSDRRFHSADGKSGSLLCLPLVSQGKLVGMVTCEHDAPRVFTVERLSVLQVLAAQAAVSLENSRLYLELEDAALTRNNLQRFFPPETMGKILQGELSLGAVETEVTAVFADISRFTDLSSRLTPTEVVELLNQYFPVIADVVFRHGGVLEKYIGDAVLAVWGAPNRRDDDPQRAIAAAVDMQRATIDINKRLPTELRLQIHVGVNTGRVAAGNVGSEHFMQYVTIGETTNVASRVCDVANAGEIVIASSTEARLDPGRWHTEPLPPVQVRGKAGALELHRLRWD
ncbi:MAG: AAA family ATPase [Pseudomonadota bacterium]